MKKFITPMIGLGFLGVLLFIYGLIINPKIHNQTSIPLGSSLPISKVGNVQRIYYDGRWHRLPYNSDSTFSIILEQSREHTLGGLKEYHRLLVYLKSQDEFFEYQITNYTDKRKKSERTILLVLGTCMLGVSLVTSVILIFIKKPPKTL